MRHLFRLAILVAVLRLPSYSLAQTGQWSSFTTANSGLYCDTITAIAFDASNTLWLGTALGLDKYDGTTWTSYYNDTHIPSNEIFDLTYDIGALFVAHRTGVTMYNGSTWQTFTPQNSGLVSAPVFHLAPDGEYIWMGTPYGLSRLSDEWDWATYTQTNTPAMPYDGISALTVDKNLNIWMAFIGTRGIVEFPLGNPTRAKFFNIDTIPNFPPGYITSLGVDGANNLWAGMEENGAVKITSSGATDFTSTSASPIPHDNTHATAIDACGKLWLATDSGVAVYNGNTWSTMTKLGGYLPNDIVNTIAVDAKGHLWFGTQGGVAEFKPVPQKPTLSWPVDGATVTHDTVNCRWLRTCPTITGYWFEIADNAGFENSTIDTTSTSLNSVLKRYTIPQNHTTYYWRIRAKSDAGWGALSETQSFTANWSSGVSDDQGKLSIRLEQNYPNPCATITTLTFALNTNERATLKLYDVLGHEVMAIADGNFEAGEHSITLDASQLQSGSYLCRLVAGSASAERLIQVMR